MYTSLLLLAWGAFLKLVSFETIAAVAFVSLSLFLIARVEEVENVKFFGPQYAKYKHSSKMFLLSFFSRRRDVAKETNYPSSIRLTPSTLLNFHRL
jgi:protein-S-isoprenylcysteine O-methyltransferase Ste14